MQAEDILSHRSLDQLESDLVKRAARLNKEEYLFLCDVREFDIRQGWKAYNFNNCAEWLNWQCQISPGTAREKVRVAHGLFNLPLISKAFREGRISYSKARPLTRIAEPENEQQLLDYALDRTAHQVEHHCLALRNARRDLSTGDANRLYRARYLSRSIHGDGSMTISAELPLELGELVMKAIEIAAKAPAREDHDTDAQEDSFFARQADALVEIAQLYLAVGPEPLPEAKASPSAGRESLADDATQARSTASAAGKKTTGGESEESEKHTRRQAAAAAAGNARNSDNYMVIVHVDESALAGRGGKSDLPLETIRRIACDCSLVALVKDKHGNPLDVGRKRRSIPPHIERALRARDRTCRYPGCTHTNFLQTHHVIHWADGGKTKVEELVRVCSRHHRLLHEGGYTVHKMHDGGFCFRNANGKLIPEAPPYRPVDDRNDEDGANASRDALIARLEACRETRLEDRQAMMT